MHRAHDHAARLLQGHHAPSNDAPTPRALGEGVVRLGALELPCAVLTNGAELLTADALARVLGASAPKHRHTARQVDRILSTTLGNAARPRVAFTPTAGRGPAFGYPAGVLIDLCNALIDLALDDRLHPKQRPALERARAILRALGRAAIETMVADACGLPPRPGSTEACANEALLDERSAYEEKLAAMEHRLRVLEAGNANGGVVGPRFASEHIERPLALAARLLAECRGVRLRATHRSLRNQLERELRYGRRGERWCAFPADPTRVSQLHAHVNRTLQDAVREHRAWARSRQPGLFDVFADVS